MSRKHGNGCITLELDGHDPFTIWYLHGLLLVASCGTLAVWAKAQYDMKTNGYFSSSQHAIFPVHLKILVLLSASSLVQGLLIIFAVEADFDGLVLNLAFGLGEGICDTFQGFITMLLLSAGIGQRSIRRSVYVGILFGSIAAVTETWYHGDAKSFEAFPPSVATRISWEGLHLVLYTCLAFLPDRALGFPRRPAIVVWAMFWSLAHFISVTLMLMTRDTRGTDLAFKDVGVCMQQLTQAFLMSIVKAWVVYHVFELEAKWWHGIGSSTGSLCALGCCGRCSGSNAEDKTEEGDSINSLFQHVELTDSAAAAMSDALDTYGQRKASTGFNFNKRFRESSVNAPGALSSIDRTASTGNPRLLSGEAGPLHRGSLLSRFTPGGSKGTQPPAKAATRVPLIDFTKLKIKQKMLGAGSTARVYEGRWCGKKCAVKVLFTVEIVPEEVQRTCMEASLLHNLQSPNVVQLFGIAVLPPSLCVVLEMCSEGSLNDVLYAKEQVQTVRDSLSLFTPSLRVSRANRSNSLRASENHPPTAKKSAGSASTYEYVYALPWNERLELALGAARGVAALVAALPGTSHNDIKSANYLVDCPETDAPSAPSETRGGIFSFIGIGRGTNKSPPSGDVNSSSSSSVSIAVNSSAPVKFVVKLADVEFASVGETPAHMTRGETPNWTAPEVLSGERAVSPASDMYALANVLFEIAVRETPFGSVTGGDAQVKKQIIDGHRPEFPDPAHWAAVERAESALNDGTAPPYVAEVETVSRQEFVAIVGRAWAPDPQSRPSAAELVEQLQTLYDTFTREVTAEREKMRRSTFLPFKAQPARPPQPEGGGTTTGTSSLAGPNGTQAGPSFTGSVLPSLKESESAST